jgi:hypothetical protein
MIYLLMQRHGDDREALRTAEYKLERKLGKNNLTLWFLPETNAHPEDQVDYVGRMVKNQKDDRKHTLVLTTNSLMIVYALNNALLSDPDLEVMAYEVFPDGSMSQCINDRWIDESVLGHVADKLHAEMNQLFAKREAAKLT